MNDDRRGLLARLLAELGGSDHSPSGLVQPYPITLGRVTPITPEERGEKALLQVQSFPLTGKVWCVNVEIVDDAAPSPAAGALAGIVALPVPNWLSLRVRWTQGNVVTYTADLDLICGSAGFPLLCDSLQVFAVNATPTPTPASSPTVRLACSVGHQGSRETAIPRRTVNLGTIPKTATRIVGIPPRATEVLVCSVDTAAPRNPLALNLVFFDWLGNEVGSAYLSPTSTPRPIDIPQGASIVSVVNPSGALDTNAALVFRITL